MPGHQPTDAAADIFTMYNMPCCFVGKSILPTKPLPLRVYYSEVIFLQTPEPIVGETQ